MIELMKDGQGYLTLFKCLEVHVLTVADSLPQFRVLTWHIDIQQHYHGLIEQAN